MAIAEESHGKRRSAFVDDENRRSNFATHEICATGYANPAIVTLVVGFIELSNNTFTLTLELKISLKPCCIQFDQ